MPSLILSFSVFHNGLQDHARHLHVQKGFVDMLFIVNVSGNKYFSLPSERLINGWDTNICAPPYGGALLYIGDNLNTGNFYFIKDEYYKRFPNCGLMGNKDNDAEVPLNTLLS